MLSLLSATSFCFSWKVKVVSDTSLMSYMDFRLYNRSKCPNTLIESPVFYKQAFVNLDFTLEVILPWRCSQIVHAILYLFVLNIKAN